MGRIDPEDCRTEEEDGSFKVYCGDDDTPVAVCGPGVKQKQLEGKVAGTGGGATTSSEETICAYKDEAEDKVFRKVT